MGWAGSPTGRPRSVGASRASAPFRCPRRAGWRGFRRWRAWRRGGILDEGQRREPLLGGLLVGAGAPERELCRDAPRAGQMPIVSGPIRPSTCARRLTGDESRNEPHCKVLGIGGTCAQSRSPARTPRSRGQKTSIGRTLRSRSDSARAGATAAVGATTTRPWRAIGALSLAGRAGVGVGGALSKAQRTSATANPPPGRSSAAR